jgi:methionyl-tRNA formyltransferase
MKIGIIGNTKQTLKGIHALKMHGFDIRFVFGLNEQDYKNKVNAVSLRQACNNYDISFNTSGDWSVLSSQELDLIITLGDSRIVPESILTQFKAVGNHGAVLPYVQGGASLVWGRMLNTGIWGISIMELAKQIDSGNILVTKEFQYNTDCTMEEFVSKADDVTIEALLDYLRGNFKIQNNTKCHVKISKHVDSEFVSNILEQTLHAKKVIYLPTRTVEDALISKEWNVEFVERFKRANDFPYPQWMKERNS